LFDLGAIHSFVTSKVMEKLRKNPSKIENGFVISTPLSETIIDHMYKEIQVNISGCELRVDLLPLKLHDFDVILRMD
jgi:hypothetical protein